MSVSIKNLIVSSLAVTLLSATAVSFAGGNQCRIDVQNHSGKSLSVTTIGHSNIDSGVWLHSSQSANLKNTTGPVPVYSVSAAAGTGGNPYINVDGVDTSQSSQPNINFTFYDSNTLYGSITITFTGAGSSCSASGGSQSGPVSFSGSTLYVN